MDEPNYLGISILELGKLHMYETYYNKLQPFFGQHKLQLHYMGCDSFVSSTKTENINNDLKNLADMFDFSNLDENHKLFSNKNREVIGKFKIETPKCIWKDEFIALRSKCYALKCGDDSKNKSKCISTSPTKFIKFVEYNICLDGEENENECDNYFLKSINHDKYLRKTRKSALSIFDLYRKY